MKNTVTRSLMIAALALLVGGMLTACNTMSGLGKDIEKVGSEIDENAREKKKYPNADEDDDS